MLQPSEMLPVIGDASTFLGHASFLAFLKRREFLKPDICSKSNPITTFLFRDELPKHIKDIGEVNKIAKKTVVRSSLMRRNSDYKSSSDNFNFPAWPKTFFRFNKSQSSFLRKETCSAKSPSSLLQGAERQGMNGQVNISPESHAYVGNLLHNLDV